MKTFTLRDLNARSFRSHRSGARSKAWIYLYCEKSSDVKTMKTMTAERWKRLNGLLNAAWRANPVSGVFARRQTSDLRR